jgi:hypothetical protein
LFPKVIFAEHQRLKAVRFSATWVEDMVELIGSKQKYFCWHDSGDLRASPICEDREVAQGLPDYSSGCRPWKGFVHAYAAWPVASHLI